MSQARRERRQQERLSRKAPAVVTDTPETGVGRLESSNRPKRHWLPLSAFGIAVILIVASSWLHRSTPKLARKVAARQSAQPVPASAPSTDTGGPDQAPRSPWAGLRP
jgi:hypothetical protein